MKKQTAYIGLIIFIIGLTMLSYGIYGHDNANENDYPFWSWVEFIGFILLIIGGIILLIRVINILKTRIKTKFYIGLLLIIIGIVTNSLYYYYSSQGFYLTGLVGIIVHASASPLPLFLYFIVGGYLVYKNRYWRYEN